MFRAVGSPSPSLETPLASLALLHGGFCHHSWSQSKVRLRLGSRKEVLVHFLGNRELSKQLKTLAPLGLLGPLWRNSGAWWPGHQPASQETQGPLLALLMVHSVTSGLSFPAFSCSTGKMGTAGCSPPAVKHLEISDRSRRAPTAPHPLGEGNPPHQGFRLVIRAVLNPRSY